MKRVTCPICGIKFKFSGGAFVCPARASHPKRPSVKNQVVIDLETDPFKFPDSLGLMKELTP